MTSGQDLLFLPDVGQVEGFVENTESRELVPIQGAYSWFLCGTAFGATANITEECPSPSSLVIHIRSEDVVLNLIRLSEDGIPRRLPPNVAFSMSGDSSTTEMAEYDGEIGFYTISVVSVVEIDDISITASLGSSSREINIQKDAVPPRILSFEPFERNSEEQQNTVTFLIVFSEEVFVNEATNSSFCDADLMPLSNQHPADELIRRSQECNIVIPSINITNSFQLSEFNQRRPAEFTTISSGEGFYVFYSVFPLEETPVNITLEIPVNSVRDFAGNTNNEPSNASILYDPQRRDTAPESLPEPLPSEDSISEGSDEISAAEVESRDVQRWRPTLSSTFVGEASAVVLLTSIILSLIASIASSFLGREITSGSIRMLNQAQKLYLTGRLAVADMPHTYTDFTKQFGWTMFDTVNRSHNSSDPTEQESDDDPMLTIEEAPRIAYTNDEGEHYQDYFNQIVFWIPLLLITLLLWHLIIVALLFYYKKNIPSFFTFPRLEIMFGYFYTPIMATASTGLFQGNKDSEPYVGLWMLIAFVFSFISLNVFIVWHTFFYTCVNERKANMFIDLGSQNDQDSQFLSKAYKFLTKRVSSLNETERNLLIWRIFNRLLMPRAQEELQRDPITQAPVQSIELVTPPETPSEFALHIAGGGGGQTRTSAGLARPSTSGQIEITESSIDEDEETEEEDTTTTTTYDRPYTTTTTVVSPQLESLHEYQNLGECCYGCWDWTVLSRVLGHPQPTSNWVGKTTSNGTNFLAAYGYIFEEYRGPRVIREEATYSVNSHTGSVNRGFLVTVMESPLRSGYGRQNQFQRFHVQVFFRLIDLVKLVLMGCLVGSINNTDDNEGQVITLLMASFLMITLMRYTRPFLNRVDMALSMFNEAADIFVFTMLLIIISSSPKSDRRRFEQMGVAMVVIQCIALAVMVLRYAVSTMSVSITCTSYIRHQNQQPQPSQLEKLIWRCHPSYLTRKYFDLWMVRALHKGLNGRRVKASELPRSVAALRYFHELRDRMFRIFSLK
eukprot:g8926.t1